MNRNFTLIVVVFVSVLLSLMLSTVFGSVLADLFSGPSAPPARASEAKVAALQADLAGLRKQLATAARPAGEAAVPTPAATGSAEWTERLRYLEQENNRLRQDVQNLHEMISALSNHGDAGNSGANAVPSPVSRELLESPELQEVVSQLQRGVTAAAEEVYERKRREEEEAALVAAVERQRQVITERMPQMVAMLGQRMDLDETTQASVTSALTEYHTRRTDMRLEAFRRNWSEQEREQHAESLRNGAVNSLVSRGLSQEQATSLVQRTEWFSRAAGTTNNAVTWPAVRPRGGTARVTPGMRDLRRE